MTFSGPRDECANHMVRVLVEASPWQEDGRYGKEQGMNEIVGGGAWSSCAEEVLQQLGFQQPSFS
ncbi:hypothetical protein TIFTF001_002475 [Ficus carica]|uniref:Uncharacterized protein n=1 Tax=Ficus carica TaxID=3494 RepID=A0AA87Z4V5_FICCA|nr:hypothetical protein TIFTF001_002475 [Ficus carica]